jgi:hypothetical protein
MPAWLIPTLKAIAPHIGTIISTAKPVFTKKSAEADPNQTGLLQQQVTELQTAVAANATHIHELAAQMQKTVTALEEGAVVAEKKLQRAMIVCVAAGVLSLIAIGVAVMALLAAT